MKTLQETLTRISSARLPRTQAEAGALCDQMVREGKSEEAAAQDIVDLLSSLRNCVTADDYSPMRRWKAMGLDQPERRQLYVLAENHNLSFTWREQAVELLSKPLGEKSATARWDILQELRQDRALQMIQQKLLAYEALQKHVSQGTPLPQARQQLGQFLKFIASEEREQAEISRGLECYRDLPGLPTGLLDRSLSPTQALLAARWDDARPFKQMLAALPKGHRDEAARAFDLLVGQGKSHEDARDLLLSLSGRPAEGYMQAVSQAVAQLERLSAPAQAVQESAGFIQFGGIRVRRKS